VTRSDSAASRRPAVVFVHGLFSSPDTWRQIEDLLRDDKDFAEHAFLHFRYASPRFRLSPLRSIPDMNVTADNLETFLQSEAADFDDISFVTHSQGGLVVQRFLVRMLINSRGHELLRVRRVIMFACPNAGSQVFLILRRSMRFWRHPQERALRPLNDAVMETQKILVARILNAGFPGSDRCPIPVFAYAGEVDDIVSPASARGVFPDTGVLPGDHFSIIQPTSREHRTYKTLKMRLLEKPPLVREATIEGPADNPSRPVAAGGAPSITAQTLPIPPMLPGLNDEESYIVARWNPQVQTVDFIMSPKTALSWINHIKEEGNGGE
jgi:pimeloyl-ACP methyl ester carboxylesterase